MDKVEWGVRRAGFVSVKPCYDEDDAKNEVRVDTKQSPRSDPRLKVVSRTVTDWKE